MAGEESAEHDGSAFPRTLPPSSQIALSQSEGSFRLGETLSIIWAVFVALYTLLHACLLIDVSAFLRLGAFFDRPVAAWLEAVTGFCCLFVVSSRLRIRAAIEPRPLLGKTSDAMRRLLSILALLGYGYHLFLLRWPWLVGEADRTMRLTIWSAVLSTTWKGVPCLAFGELLSLSALISHACLGVYATRDWQLLTARSARVRIVAFLSALLVWLLGCAVIVTLATGER